MATTALFEPTHTDSLLAQNPTLHPWAESEGTDLIFESADDQDLAPLHAAKPALDEDEEEDDDEEEDLDEEDDDDFEDDDDDNLDDEDEDDDLEDDEEDDEDEDEDDLEDDDDPKPLKVNSRR